VSSSGVVESRMNLLFPELLLLLVPLLFLYFWRARSRAIGGATRVIIIAIIALLAAVPLAPLGGRGVDVVVIADLSRSMPAESRARSLEIVTLLEQQRSSGDRVGIVTFGREARIERLPEELGEAVGFVQEINADGSDLGAAIGLAASLIPRGRPGRLVVLSDGESNGEPVAAAAHEAAARGLRIDYRTFRRSETADIAVQSLDLPGTVDEREPFQFTASVRADRTIDSEAILFRNGVEISRTSRTFEPGTTQLTFRDLIDRPGVARYRLELTGKGDRVPENNIGDGAVRVRAPATLLVVNSSGGPDNLTRALSAGKLNVRTIAPSALPRDVAELVAYRGVILENVPASAVGPDTLSALAHYTNDLGGGLLLTGGTASFGVGGYFKSVLDPHLPVSMEIKNEHRKLSLAMVVVLDRSGSMAMATGDGRTKMDLANLGTCAAIETLGPFDEVGVIAVDSSPHVITPLTSAGDKEQVCDEVRRIQSMGGGIFTYTALVTAARMVQESEKGTRHIVLFADAADAEEPGEYQRLLETLTPLGITVSVIGLGSESDSDAAFLKDVAARGGGRIHFTASAEELPRLFAQEAITVARSSFITEPTAAHALADMMLLGELPASTFPTVDGYNLTYLRPGATMGVVTTDEYRAPVLAFWHRGLGRIASLTTEVDGEYSQRLNAWRDFQGFAIGLGRWLLGGEPPVGTQASIERDGGQGIVRVELDPDRVRGGSNDVRAATASILPPDARPGAEPQRLHLTWVDEHTLEARFPVQSAGMYLGAVQLGSGTVLPLAPLSLPYSPEFEPREDPEEGEKALREIARITGGVERTTWDDVFDPSGLAGRQVRDLVWPITLALLLLHVLEIAGRRLLWFDAARAWIASLRIPRLRPLWPRRSSSPTGSAEPPAVHPERAASEPAVAAGGSASNSQPSLSPLARAKAKARGRVTREG
jgi:Mg-chelatase subunit ChlD